jgi:hypothetical protein
LALELFGSLVELFVLGLDGGLLLGHDGVSLLGLGLVGGLQLFDAGLQLFDRY